MKEFTNKAGQTVSISNTTLKACLESAIDTFNANDSATLLLPRKTRRDVYVREKEQGWGGASERSIAHRLAVYLECKLREAGIIESGGDIAVDCEYNRHLNGLKHQRISTKLLKIVKKARRKAKRVNGESTKYFISVAPDIVVHKRGEDTLNLLVVEIKKLSNPEIKEYDQEKLKCFTKQGQDEFGYELGFAVVAIDNVPPGKRKLALGKLYGEGKLQSDNCAMPHG